jgi:DNA-binding NarL/FixJ family response regulator
MTAVARLPFAIRTLSDCPACSHVRAFPPLCVADQNQIVRVALVEDHQTTREGIVTLLNNSAGFVCVAACASAEDALKVIPLHTPDVILMDIELPKKSGIDCIRDLKAGMPQLQVMVLTIFEDHERIFESLAAGATGYLLKTTTPAKLLQAIQELHAGGAPMSGQVARQVVAAFGPPAAESLPGARLSPIERRVLQLLARGLLYKEVAGQLAISTSTVRTHIWHIYKKLQVNNRTEAVLKGLPRRVL